MSTIGSENTLNLSEISEKDLNNAPLPQLISLQENLTRIINERKVNERSSILLEIQKLAMSSGYSLDELVDSSPLPVKRIAKYQNLENHDVTWSGRGRRPIWVSDYLKNGGNINDLLIPTHRSI